MTEKTKNIPYYELSKPFKKIDVAEFDIVKVDGFPFPLKPFPNGKVMVKDEKELKPPISVNRMIEKLANEHEISFTPKEKEIAKKFLLATNYYRLSIFIRYLKEDKSFSALKEIYDFDAFLSEKVGNLIVPLEVYIKTTLAHVLCMNYESIIRELGKKGNDVHPSLIYLDMRIYKAKFINNHSIEETLTYIAKSLYDKQERELSLEHHISYYQGWIPFWVLVEHITFGDVTTIIRDLERKVRKRWADEALPGNKIKELVEWMNAIRILRNTSAHCSRFYGRNFTYNPTLNGEDLKTIYYEKEEDTFKNKFKNTFFAGIIVLKTLYHNLSEEEHLKWNEFINELEYRLKSSNLDEKYLGFNSHWKNALQIKIESPVHSV